MNNMSSENKTPSVCNCINLRRASLVMTELYDKYLAPSGLNINQFSLLRHIDRLGPASVSDVALKMRLDRTTLVRNLKAMEQQGYVQDIAAKGSRSRQLTLTESGEAVLIAAGQLWDEAQNSVEQSLGTEDLAALTSLLSKVESMMP
ncbi:DNA-binding MarR family transcriptional regulator [Paenibacillus forsythiae]|uniref:DNA-binding MarR family transcriptional regulator n=1 Tax=Paenibacillus forsythiae TaxID=365616 RepID=A0ABU3H216_9BACL|nr:MarR family winged helix-turn-helix transcriptional regulator [Paenibacillus forsythiae]MDT3424870.1 DNA-binding MarR family transcriptional regulator [Paenibacillus forsythiae]